MLLSVLSSVVSRVLRGSTIEEPEVDEVFDFLEGTWIEGVD